MKEILFFVCCFLFLSVFVYASDAIDINTASLKELEELSGVGPVIGQRIIDARPFSSVDDLLRVKGIGEKTLQKIKDQGLAYVENGAMAARIATTEEKTATEPITAIVFNEILPSPEGADETEEWIEIFNQNDFEVDLSGWKIKDSKGTATDYVFPKNTKISSRGYLVLKRPETKIILNNTEDGLNLFSPDGKIVDSLIYDNAPKNQSYSRTGNVWQWSSPVTPGAPLPTTKKSDNSDNSNDIDNKSALAGISYGKEVIKENISGNKTNPWFLFFFASIITVISGIIILILKVKLSKI